LSQVRTEPPASPDSAKGALRTYPATDACATTGTQRFVTRCACPTYPDNWGTCATFESGENGRCVYCDHAKRCHDTRIVVPPNHRTAAQPEPSQREAKQSVDALGPDSFGGTDFPHPDDVAPFPRLRPDPHAPSRTVTAKITRVDDPPVLPDADRSPARSSNAMDAARDIVLGEIGELREQLAAKERECAALRSELARKVSWIASINRAAVIVVKERAEQRQRADAAEGRIAEAVPILQQLLDGIHLNMVSAPLVRRALTILAPSATAEAPAPDATTQGHLRGCEPTITEEPR
jgi:hypothetical protein